MARNSWLHVVVLASLAAVSCSKSDDSTTSITRISILATPERIQANGLSSLTVDVTNGVAPVTLRTTRGTFENGETSITIAVIPGTATLRTCDARLDASCAGPVRISGVDAKSGVGSTTAQFDGFEVCFNGNDDNGNGLVDCADPQCPLNATCSATGMVCGTDDACSKCTPAGGVAEPAAERTCDDGVDNDCDGKIDCADADCGARVCDMASGASGVCTGGACTCSSTGGTESVCSNGVDDDCDGVVDCLDPDCVGDVCDAALGLVCPGTTPRDCGVCPTGQSAETAAQCGDGKDNDCDGTFDCADADCQPAGGLPGDACNAFGGRCILSSGVPSCGCPGGATTESACQGGVDDDCDGKIDCADTDCQPAVGGTGQACGTFGRTCTSAGACACAGTTEICDNYDGSGQPVDDDCDGRANCQDFDCRPTTPGATGSTCSTQGEFGKACDATGACICTGNGGTAEVAELSCDDGFDNDCDFLLDCQDPDCAARSCGPAGAQCAALACACPGGTTESSCTDRIDNDCDGKIDCEEASCAAQACDATNPALACIASSCTDPASQYAVTLTPARTRLPAVGAASTTVAISVKMNGVAKAGVQVALALDDATLGTLSPAGPVTTDFAGNASVTFRASGAVGTVTITGTVVGVGATGTGLIAIPAIGEIRVATGGVQHTVMGVRTSGFREQNLLRVEVLDSLQQPYPAGLDVTFEHRPLGGSTLSALLAAPTCVELPCVQSRGTTDASGGTSVSLFSGTVAGTVTVTARATAGGVLREFVLPSIAVVGAKPNAGHLSIVCGPQNVPAFAGHTCHVSTIDAPFTCVALAKDRFNNVLGRTTMMTFMSEAGSVGPPSATDAAGEASVLVSTLGGKLPKDVPANPGEQFVAGPANVCGVTQRSPRDGVVTVVAWTTGEEAFHDSNADGDYDFGEPFIDSPEPFVDYDDNDVRDGDEPFVDTDLDGTWDAPNGRWDASTNIWTKTVVVYTGYPAYGLTGGALQTHARWMEVADAPLYPAPTAIPSFSVRPTFPAESFTDCNLNGRWDFALRETFTDVDLDGSYDPGEPFSDCDGDLTFDTAAVQEPYSDVDGNGSYDAFIRPATSESLVVMASDANLNRLATEAKYEVRKPDTATFVLTYNGKPTVPDRLGFGFSYQPCRSTLLTSCALDCADVTTVADPVCHLRTRVADFSYGVGGTVVVKGGGAGAMDGPTEAFWDVTLFEETLSVPVSGTHQ